MTRITRHLDDDLAKKALAREFKTHRFGRKLKNTEAIILPGAGTKAIYIKNRENDDWQAPPSLKRDIKPAVDLLLQDEEIQNSLETLLINQFSGDREQGIPETEVFCYFDIDGYLITSRKEEDFFNALKSLSYLDTLYPDSQLSHDFLKQYSRDSAPDILLITKPGLFFTPNKGKYGHHGSIYPSDCLVSFMLGGPGLSQKLTRSYIIEEKASVLDVVPTVGRLLNIEIPFALDGKDIFATHNIDLQ